MGVEAVRSYDEFFRSNSDALRRLAYGRTGSWTVAEDLVQDVLADAYRRWSRIAAYDDPMAWARRAVLNRSISRWRASGREARAMSRLGGQRPVSNVVEPHLTDSELWAALRRLPRQQLQVALLLWFEELSVAEVAATINCKPDTVRTHWRRARQSLASALGVDEDPLGVPDSNQPTVADLGGET